MDEDGDKVAQENRRGERGASSVEAALIFPALILLFFAILQGAVTLHAGNVAQATAEAAYEEARLYQSSAEAGESAGLAAAAAAGGGLDGASVQVTITETTVTVVVTGKAPSLVPGFPLEVERSITGPVERWAL